MATNSNSVPHDIVIFDTSVILHDSNCLYGFENNDIIIPLVVLDEVDKFRNLDNEVGRNARSFIRNLNKLLANGGSLNKGVKRLPSGELIIVNFFGDSNILAANTALDLNKNDDRILAACLEVDLAITDQNIKVTLISKDISLLAKANVLDINCTDYNIDIQIQDPNQLYTGLTELIVPSHIIDSLYDNGRVLLKDLDPECVKSFESFENMGVTLTSSTNDSHTALVMYRKGSLNKFIYAGKSICHVRPQNREQMVAFELMLDPNIKLVTLTGTAGTGKTLGAIACGVHMAMDLQLYDRIVVSRPIQPIGKDLGYLPGDLYEKMTPWIGPIKDSIEFIFGGDRNKMDQLMQFGLLDIEPLTYIRGRSLPRTLFILDESQHLTKHEIKTIITRIGQGSKIILTGDVFQIDNHYLDSVTNGLTCVVEKFKTVDLAGHVTLTKGQRSKLASLAADIL